jgi:alkylhydroperoxidase/carboxymuconolactone decarboxylase family protein YurZ
MRAMDPVLGEEQPLVAAVLDINAASITRVDLPMRELMMIRLAALVAVDAPVLAYLMNLDAVAMAGLDVDEVRQVLIAAAPIVGTARTVSAADRLVEAFGIAVAEALEDAVASGALGSVDPDGRPG